MSYAGRQPGRNDSCPCGSGKKFKKCCQGRAEHTDQKQSPWPSVRELAVQARNFYENGLFEDARQICNSIFLVSPSDEEANHIAGLIEYKLGNLDEALGFLKKAIGRGTKNPFIYVNYAKLLVEKNQLNGALLNARLALKLDKNLDVALVTYGNLLIQEQNFLEARDCYKKVITNNHDHIEARSGYLFCISKLGKTDEAIKGYLDLINSAPAYISAYINLANLYIATYEIDKAIETAEKAASIDDRNPEIYNFLGSILVLKNMDKAELCFKKAIELRPDYTSAYVNLFNVLHQKKDLEQSLGYANRIDGLSNWSELKSFAAEIFGRAAAYDKRTILSKKIIEFTEHNPAACADIHQFLLLCNYIEGLMAETIFRLHTCWNEQALKHIEPLVLAGIDKSKDRVLRIGYLSREFRTHPVGLFVKNILDSSKYSAVKNYCYSDYEFEDEITKEIRSKVNHFSVVAGKTPKEIAQTIQDDGIDILVDLAGHTSRSNAHVLAFKPAPIQVSYLGYPNTSGSKKVDYRITDGHADIAGGTIYSETLAVLPESFLCFGEFQDVAIDDQLPEEINGFLTFGSFNNIQKLNRPTIELWSELLSNTPGSKLLLKELSFDSKIVRDNIIELFEGYGIEADRLVFRGRLDAIDEHLDLYNSVDIALDPFPYNGTTTTCEALWMGVPVVTYTGNLHPQRVSYSILKNIGLDHLASYSEAQYIQNVQDLVTNKKYRKELRASLRGTLHRSILCDSSRFIGQLEDLYRKMWQFYCEK